MANTSRRLVIVESPAKAAKIAGYLGPDYIVESSRGHIRDLPERAAEVPAKYKGESWARTGVDVEHEFTPLYVVSADKKATIKKLKADLADASELLLATDEDREGEAIAWHLLQELKPKVPVRRMVFHEITPQAISAAVANPRDLNTDLVDAQETRRILDRLYGYEVSPVLWKKVMPKLSAGRVQSVATRLVVDRERERMAFTAAAYCDIAATLKGDRAAFEAHLTKLEERKIAQGRDFSATGAAKASVLVLDEPTATALAEVLKKAAFEVATVEAKPFVRRPAAPFRTTTLQQEAGRKLGFTTQRTMSVAQELYEGGFITYMRTDSVTLSSQAISAARNWVSKHYGPAYLPTKPRTYSSKVKNAQEAHEAIRPAGEEFVAPSKTGLTGDQRKLYELIWQRTLASQMSDAQGQSVSVQIEATLPQRFESAALPDAVQQCTFAASGHTITFDGFFAAYVESSDEKTAEEKALPPLQPAQHLTPTTITAEAHQTKPPARYTEPSLVAKLEELEIGRPSTYASIIRTITARDYVFKKGSALVPTWLAFAVTRLLEEHFPNLVDYQFTADLEDKLDQIANGDAERLAVLRDFYFGSDAGAAGLQALTTSLGDIDARATSTFNVGSDGVVVRVGRYGTYIEDPAGNRANVPDDLPPDELTAPLAQDLLANSQTTERPLGVDPATGHQIVAKSGRYGPYVTEELPETTKKTKPRTASLFKTMDLDSVTLDQALELLSLPRTVGTAEDGTVITAQNGRFGPYLKQGSESRSLASEADIFTVDLETAKALFAQPKARGRSAGAGPLRELGSDPATGAAVTIKDGRFGPYITDGETNVTVPRTETPEAITPEHAFELLAAKRAKGPAPKRRRTTRKATGKKRA